MNFILLFNQRRNCFVNLNLSTSSSCIKPGSVIKLRSATKNNEFLSLCNNICLNCSFNSAEINGLLGWHNGFYHNEEIIIEEVSVSVCYISSVRIVPYSNDDWYLVNSYNDKVEEQLLKQINIVYRNLTFPIWVDGLNLLLKVESFEPEGDVPMLSSSTVVYVIPNSQIRSNTLKSSCNNKELSVLPKLPKSNNMMSRFYVLMDFIYFLMFGKTLKERKKEKIIYQQWKSKLEMNIEISLASEFVGRCYKFNKDTDNGNSTSDAEIWVNSKTITGKRYLASFSKLQKTDENFEFYVIVKFVNNSEKNCSNQFIFSDNIWNEFSFQVGDRLICRLHSYEISEKLTSITVEVPDSIEDNQMSSIKLLYLNTIHESEPTLLRSGMILYLNLCDDITIPVRILVNNDSDNISSNYFLTCGFLIKLNNIPISMKRNTSHNKITRKDSRLSLKDWDKSDLLLAEICDLINDTRKNMNLLIVASSGSGKSYFCKKLTTYITECRAYQYHSQIVDCRELLGLQPDILKSKINTTLRDCVLRSPSLFVLDNIDLLAPATGLDHGDSQHEIQLIHISNCLKYMLENIKSTASIDRIVVIGTASQESNLNSILTEGSVFDKVFYVKESAFFAMLCQLNSNDDNKMESLDNFLKKKSKIINNLSGYDGVRFVNQMATLNYEENIFESDNAVFCNRLEEVFRNCLVKSNTINHPSHRYYFDDIYGLEDVKSLLTETFIWPFKYPKLFARCPIKLQRGILLYGLPGCGKSYLAMALANELGINFRYIKGPELLNKYIGSSEARIRQLFAELREHQPSLVFFDEFDALAPKRGHDSTGVTDRVVNQLLTEIDGVGSDSKSVFILAASNRPDLIDPAILRPGRISGRGFCWTPDNLTEKVAALIFLMNKCGIYMSEEERSLIDEYLLEKQSKDAWLNCYSYADLHAIVNETVNNAVLRYDQIECDNNVVDSSLSRCSISLMDLEKAIQCSRASLSQGHINQYNRGFQVLLGTKAASIIDKPKATLA